VTAALLTARLALAVLFLVAGVAKLFDRAGFRAAMIGMGVPAFLATSLALALPVTELFTGLALLPAASATWGGWAALMLLGGFTLGVAVVLIRGVTIDCHCFGQLSSGAVGWSTLVRNAVLAMIAAAIVMGQGKNGSPSYLEWLGGLSPIEGLALAASMLALTLLLAGTWFGMHLMRQHGRVLLRLDALEKELGARGLISAHILSGPQPEGLPAGNRAPDFVASNLQGGSTSLGDLLVPGLPLLLLFIRPSCAPCTALLPEVARWQDFFDGTITLAVISQGDIAGSRLNPALAGIRRVLVEREFEISNAFSIHTTPSAMMIAVDGTVASDLALGAPAIRRLFGTIAPRPAAAPRLAGTPSVSFDAG
jgi:hypothetical protein